MEGDDVLHTPTHTHTQPEASCGTFCKPNHPPGGERVRVSRVRGSKLSARFSEICARTHSGLYAADCGILFGVWGERVGWSCATGANRHRNCDFGGKVGCVSVVHAGDKVNDLNCSYFTVVR